MDEHRASELPPQALDPQGKAAAEIGIDPTLARGQKSASEAASEGGSPGADNARSGNLETGTGPGFVGSAQDAGSEAYIDGQGTNAVAEIDVTSVGDADVESARPFGRDDGSETWH